MSRTMATRVDEPVVVPTLLDTTLGDGWIVILAAVADVIPTVSESLVAGASGSYTWIVATLAWVVVRVAVAFPATTGTVTTGVVPFHMPVVVANVTLAAAGALTCTASDWPIFIAVIAGLPATTAPSNVC